MGIFSVIDIYPPIRTDASVHEETVILVTV